MKILQTRQISVEFVTKACHRCRQNRVGCRPTFPLVVATSTLSVQTWHRSDCMTSHGKALLTEFCPWAELQWHRFQLAATRWTGLEDTVGSSSSSSRLVEETRLDRVRIYSLVGRCPIASVRMSTTSPIVRRLNASNRSGTDRRCRRQPHTAKIPETEAQ